MGVVEGQGGFAHTGQAVDHNLGGIWGQIGRQLIEFRRASDEPWSGWGQVCERTRQGTRGSGIRERRGLLDRDVDWPAGLNGRRLWLRKLAIQAQQALGGLNVLGLAQEQHADHKSPEDNPTRRAMAQERAGDPCFEFLFVFGQGDGPRCQGLHNGQRKAKA